MRFVNKAFLSAADLTIAPNFSEEHVEYDRVN